MTKANDSGQTAVEFAISLFVFFLLVLATMDFGYIYSTKLTLQNAVRQGGRYAITGQCVGTSGTCSITRYNSILQTVENYSLGLLSQSPESTLNVRITAGCAPIRPVGRVIFVTITVTYPYKFMTGPIGAFFPGNSYTIKVSSAFTNEMFAPGSS